MSISGLSNKWADWLVNNGAPQKNHDVYVYGAECFFNEIIADALVFAIAFFIGRPLEMLIWQVFWLPFRINLGGHHAGSHFMCIFLSTLLAVACVCAIPFIVNIPWIVWPEIIFSLIIAFFIAPVVHPNHPVSDARILRFKKTGRIVCIVETALIILSYFLVPLWVSHIAALGMASAALLCLIGKFSNPRNQQSAPGIQY